MLTLLLPFVVLIVGALLWKYGRGRLQEAGRILFACAALVLTDMLGHESVGIGILNR